MEIDNGIVCRSLRPRDNPTHQSGLFFDGYISSAHQDTQQNKQSGDDDAHVAKSICSQYSVGPGSVPQAVLKVPSLP